MLFLTKRLPSHLKYEPRTLYQLAFDKFCLSLWNVSPLPSLHAEAAHNYIQQGSDDDDEEYKEYLQKSRTTLENIEKSLQSLGKVPFHRRMKIMCVVSGIDNDMRDFAFAVAGGLANKTTENIKYCMEHVAVTEDFTINLTKSICYILRMSKFDITFTIEFLAHHCVKKSKVVKAYKLVCKELKTSVPAHDFTVKVSQIQQFIDDMVPGTVFWKEQRSKGVMDYGNKNLCNASDFQYVAVVGSIDALSYYCDVACKKVDNDGAHKLRYLCAKYAFQIDTPCAEKILFFLDGLEEKLLDRLLDQDFVKIFMTLLRSWRHRSACVEVFKEVKNNLDIGTIQSILKDIAYMEIDKYQYYEILTTVKELWNVIPESCKADRKIASTIPELLLQRKDINKDDLLLSLTHFLKDYTTEMQEEMISCIIFKLVSTSQEKHIKTCLNTANELGLKTKEGKEYLTKDRLINLIVHDAETSTKTDYDKVTKYICNNVEEENALKLELLQDKHFIVDFLVNVKDSLLPFLEWALNEESKINVFKTKLITEDLIEDIYQRRLLQFTSFNDANEIFNEEMLNLNEQQITEIQRIVKNNENVLYGVLLNSFESHCFNREAFFEALSFSKKEKIKLMCKFLGCTYLKH